MNSTWLSFLNGILKMPGAKINREKFLRETLKGISANDMATCISESPVKVIPVSKLESIADSLISSHTTKVTTLSAISGIPGGLAIIATIPADLANYYYHVVAIGQKLGYLYGFPDMIDTHGNLTKDGEIMLTAFIGIMNKVTMANELIKKIAVEISKRISEETATKVAQNILSKQIVSQSVEVVARKLGTQVTAKTASRGLSKAIPFVSGIICGVLTYSTFRPQANRLHEALKKNIS